MLLGLWCRSSGSKRFLDSSKQGDACVTSDYAKAPKVRNSCPKISEKSPKGNCTHFGVLVFAFALLIARQRSCAHDVTGTAYLLGWPLSSGRIQLCSNDNRSPASTTKTMIC